MKIIKSQKKKRENTGELENPIKSPEPPSTDDKEQQETIVLLKSSQSNYPLQSRKDKKEKRRKSRNGSSRGSRNGSSRGSVTQAPPSPAEWISIAPIRVVKTVTFKDE
jgi:hypothetical protein